MTEYRVIASLFGKWYSNAYEFVVSHISDSLIIAKYDTYDLKDIFIKMQYIRPGFQESLSKIKIADYTFSLCDTKTVI